MIAVLTEKYRGVRTLEAGQSLPKLSKRVLARFSPRDGQLLEQVLTGQIQFMDNSMFHDRKSARQIEKYFDDGQEELLHAQARLVPIELYEQPDKAMKAFKPLGTDQEMELFLKLNFARQMLCKLRRKYTNHYLTLTAAREFLKWEHRSLRVQSQLTQANIPLVLAMAKRARPNGVDFAELISEGNMALLRSVDKFDCSRGFKFSTYACRAILKSFSRTALKATRYRGRFPVEFDPDLEKGDQLGVRREDTETHCVDWLRGVLGGDEAELSEIERKVLCARFAVGEENVPEKPMTLEQVGKIVGVTKERVRQIQNKALAKLRVVLEETVLSG